MAYDFDRVIDRSGTDATKLQKYAGTDILPFWIADMDFAVPDFILDPLRERLEHPIIGYTKKPDSLTLALQNWLVHHYGWHVPEDWIVWLPGVVPGLNMAVNMLAADAQLLVPTPIYYPFLDLQENSGRRQIAVPLTLDNGLWSMDFAGMNDALSPQTKMVCIANPQNPTGRCYSLGELQALAGFIEEHDLLLVSDEIHCQLILDEDKQHLPIAHAVPEIAHRTVSLFAATKTYNIPGLGCAAAIVPDAALRQRFVATRGDLVPGPGPLNYIASEAAFNDRSDWVPQLLTTLRRNRDLVRAVAGERMTTMQATYLAWLNIEDLQLNDVDGHFESHGLGLSNGAPFGHEGYVRFNFASPRPVLEEGLRRLSESLRAG
jgi:cystathionine beta-lyase